MENREVARILRETAKLLEIDGRSIGRYRSYDRAAELISAASPNPIEEIARDPEKLTAYPGIGDGMADHIREILNTGDYSLRAKLLKKYPVQILDLLRLQSLGPKKAACCGKFSGRHGGRVETRARGQAARPAGLWQKDRRKHPEVD